jgi:hypothetical protein
MDTGLDVELEKAGFNRDIEIDQETWEKAKEQCQSSRKSLATTLRIEQPVYRDGKIRKSIELKDYRKREFEADFVAELEHFNPEKRPISHIIVDFPHWLWKNRIKNRGPRKR